MKSTIEVEDQRTGQTPVPAVIAMPCVQAPDGAPLFPILSIKDDDDWHQSQRYLEWKGSLLQEHEEWESQWRKENP